MLLFYCNIEIYSLNKIDTCDFVGSCPKYVCISLMKAVNIFMAWAKILFVTQLKHLAYEIFFGIFPRQKM